MPAKVKDRTQMSLTIAHAQSLRAQCDLELSASDMVLVPDTLSCHGGYSCNIIVNSHHGGQSNSPDTNMFDFILCKNFKKRTVIFTFKLATNVFPQTMHQF